MREIKFRGIDSRYNVKDGHPYNVFRYGNLIICENGDHIIETGRKQYGYSGISCKVDPETVGQYTGLKGENDEEIYEGDIVTARERSNMAPFTGQVHFENCQFIVKYVGYEGYSMPLAELHKAKYEPIKRISNANQDPEPIN